MVAVLFLDELTFHAEVGNNILVSSVKNIIIDLVHPDVALLYLLFGHDAVSAGCRSVRLGERGAVMRIEVVRRLFSDGVRHGHARVNQRQVPVGIAVGIAALVHVIPVQSPGAQIDVVVERVVAVFVVAVDPDQVVIVQKAGIGDPVRMCQCRVREPAALGHDRAVLAGSGFLQADGGQRHGVGSGVVLIPERDGTRIVCANGDLAADIPPLPLHALVRARATGHFPPAVPCAVPPVEQRVAGRGGQPAVIRHARLRGLHAAERGGVDSDLAAFLAEDLFKSRLHRSGRVAQHIGRLHLQRRTRRDVRELAVYHGFIALVVGNDCRDLQLRAVLHNGFVDAPEIRGVFLAVVCEVQCQNDCVISVRIFHDARALVEQLIVAELDQIGIFRLILSAGGEAAEQHRHRKKQA